MGMGTKYENLIHLVGRSPEHLRDLLVSIEVPSTIMPGSWYVQKSKHGVWVMLDRPARKVKKKDLDKSPQVEVTEPTRTENVESINENNEV